MAKLKKLLEEIAFENDAPKINKHEVIESVAAYGSLGKQLYSHNISEMAKGLIKIAEDAQNHVLSETDDWFDKVSISRNMKSLNGMVKEFKKGATEYNALNQRLTALYEDMGTILNRYYDITEAHENGEHEPVKGDKEEYQKFFKSALEKYGVTEPDQLEGDRRKDFFNYVDKNWVGDNESD